MSKEEAVVVKSDALAQMLGITDESNKELSTIMGGSHLPRIQLMTSSSPEVKKGTFKSINHFALVEGSTLTAIGEQVDCLVLAVRSTAIDKNGPNGVVFCHDQKLVDGQPTGMFRNIMQRSFEKDSGCFYGPEFLLFLPKLNKFVTFLMGSKTARNDAPGMVNLYGKAATLKAHLIPNKQHGDYMSPMAVPCDTVFTLPAPDEMLGHVERFKNPAVKEVAGATKATSAEAAAQDMPQ